MAKTGTSHPQNNKIYGICEIGTTDGKIMDTKTGNHALSEQSHNSWKLHTHGHMDIQHLETQRIAYWKTQRTDKKLHRFNRTSRNTFIPISIRTCHMANEQTT